MTRNSHRSGMEEITLTATSRVTESENYALDRRSRDVSTEGLTINSVSVDTSPPATMIEEAESALRLMLLTKATKQLVAINEHLDSAKYRLGDVEFGNANNNMEYIKHDFKFEIDDGNGIIFGWNDG